MSEFKILGKRNESDAIAFAIASYDASKQESNIKVN